MLTAGGPYFLRRQVARVCVVTQNARASSRSVMKSSSWRVSTGLRVGSQAAWSSGRPTFISASSRFSQLTQHRRRHHVHEATDWNRHVVPSDENANDASLHVVYRAAAVAGAAGHVERYYRWP